MTKGEMRETLLAQRRRAHRSEGSGPIKDMVSWLQDLLGQNKLLGAYRPIRTERDPAPLLGGLNAILCYPRVQGASRPLQFYQTKGPEDFETGAFGVFEPLTCLPIVIPPVILLPLVGFDAQGYRLGYGGGFYDRTLAEIRAQQTVLAIGFAYDGQLSDQPLNFEASDARLDAVITPTRRYEFTKAGPGVKLW